MDNGRLEMTRSRGQYNISFATALIFLILPRQVFAFEEGFSWEKILPFWNWLSSFEKSDPGLVNFATIDAAPMVYALFVSLFIIVLAGIARFFLKFSIVPSEKVNARNILELIVEAVLYFAGDIIGPQGKKYLPLLGTLAIFILFSNLLGLVPGFAPCTANININLGMAVVVFVLYQFWGIREHGLSYFKHFIGPIWWLAPLYLPIEIVSHLARMLSLSVRLFGNMTGDHLVLAMFTSLVPFLLPVTSLALGAFVCLIQTLIFVALSMMYISLATEESEH